MEREERREQFAAELLPKIKRLVYKWKKSPPRTVVFYYRKGFTFHTYDVGEKAFEKFSEFDPKTNLFICAREGEENYAIVFPIT